MKRASSFLVTLLALAAPVAAQESSGGDPSVAGIRGLYATVRGYITASAEQMPEGKYSFRPTPDVRSFGEILGHVANAHYMFCASVKGEQAPSMPDAEKLATKAEIQQALAGSFAYCDEAYRIGTAEANDPLSLFGQSHTKLSMLAFNQSHDWEHYGNLVTYLRINGMVPPSSQGGM
jgi:uncharacterized damage-inducible protein DinB